MLKSVDFYKSYLDTIIENLIQSENQYHVLEKDSRPRSGVIKFLLKMLKPHWMPTSQ
jgi:hypothetical protein